MKCLRIKFILPNHYPLTFEKGKKIILRFPEGNFEFKINILKKDIYTSYTLKSSPIDEKIGSNTIKQIENALFLLFNKFDIGLLINQNLASGVITEYGKKKLGENFRSDFIGVKFVDCNLKYVDSSASATGALSGHNFVDTLNDIISQKNLIDERLIRAIELYNSTKYLSRVNLSGKFILLMSSIECLISQNKNNQEIIAIIQEAQKRIKLLELDKEIIDSVTGSLTFLKLESIKRSGKSLVSELFSSSDAKFNGLTPVDFFSKAYDLRSKLIHEGKAETKLLSIERVQMQEFTSSCLRRYYEKYCS